MVKPRFTRWVGVLGVIAIVWIGDHSLTKTDLSDLPPTASVSIQPSQIPNMHLAAKHYAVSVVDLRRADLLLGMPTEPVIFIKPLLDTVLFVPKKFGHARALDANA
ncbi:MAG: hypothetical protein NTU48_01415 [Legionellales bacterium]|nr:hypothetical protein [Legionellales bacterium]